MAMTNKRSRAGCVIDLHDKNPKVGNSKGLVIDNFLDDELVDSGYTYRLTYLGKQGKEITLQGKEINLLSCHTENRLEAGQDWRQLLLPLLDSRLPW